MHKKLILFGGGSKPTSALHQFRDWAGEPSQTHLLIITWASDKPHLTRDFLLHEFNSIGITSIETSLTPPVHESDKILFLSQLAQSNAVFFSGGDQNLILDVLRESRIKKALQQRYESGIVFAGTSAGMAILSPICIAGDIDPTQLSAQSVTLRDGLGLLKGVIVDQHFLKRQRQNRLFSLALKHPDIICIGVDEDAALAVFDNRYAQAHGQSEQVLIMDTMEQDGFVGVTFLGPQQEFDLQTRKRAQRGAFATHFKANISEKLDLTLPDFVDHTLHP